MSETVSKTKATTATGSQTEAAAQAETPRKTSTKWRVFEDGKFVPIVWRCEGYKSSHPADMSCHSNLKVEAENVIRHIAPEHGGGWFLVKFRISDSKVHPIWRQLEEAGVELQDFTCPHCRTQIAVNPRAIVQHLQGHAGATRINPWPQTLAMTLGYRRADMDEMDSLYINEAHTEG